MESSSHSFIDYFKLFKVFELKKIEKTGLVKIIQDKMLNRKVVSVEGNISTSNFITLQTHNMPNIPFSERYLYIQGFLDAGKSFCFQVAYTLGNKSFKAVYSTLYKIPKKHVENTIHLPLNLPPTKWSIGVIDLYELGLHFGFNSQEMKMIFKVNSIQIRASSKVKGVFQSDYLYSIDKMPKDMMFPLKKQQSFFEKYHYFVESTDPTCLKQIQFKQDKQIELKKKIIEHQQRQKIKQNKSLDNKKPLPITKSRKSIDKIEKVQNGNDLKVTNNSKKANYPQIPASSRNKKQQKMTKNIQKQEQIADNDIEQQQIEPPKPQPALAITMQCVEGFTINNGNLMSVESYLCKPAYMPVHKPITILTPCDQNHMRVVTGYNDGSICVWDTIRKSPLGYFMTELSELKIILTDSKLNIILVGLDKLKRQVINIVSDGSVVFRQISNFNIIGAALINNKTFQYGLITFGFENIRLWTINNEKSIIQGTNIYLGQTNRKVKYTAAIVIPTKHDYLAYVSDSNGFITTISITQSKMIQSIKIDSCCIDKLLLLYDGRGIISNEQGVIKIVSLDRMEVQQQYSLNNRIKDIRQLQSEQIVMTHYNKSIGLLNLSNSMYSFTMRSHTSTITKIAYSPYLNKVVSISKDNSIRIWQYVVDDGVFHYRLQQQYQFIIAGQEMVDIVCAVQGKIEDASKVIVGGDSGKLRIINIQKYSIEQEVIIEKGSMSLSISRNAKYIICTYESGNSYLLDFNFTILFKYLQNDSGKKKMKIWKNGFNRINKEYFIQNVEQEKLEFYSLKEQNLPIFTIKMDAKSTSQISFIGNRVFILCENQLKIYEKGTMMQVLNLSEKMIQKSMNKCICFDFPIVCYGTGEKLVIKIINAKLQQQIDLPQPLNSISINYNSDKGEGLIFCSGSHSYSLYVFSFKLHNVEQSINQQLIIQQQKDQENNQLEISFSNKTTISAYPNKIQENHKRNNNFEQQVPKQLKKLYAKQEQLYEEVKQYLLPKQFKNIPKYQINQQEQRQQFEEESQTKQLSIKLNYGYEIRQIVKDENDIGSFHWINQNNSLILLTGCGKSIVQHFFTVPIKHKIIHFPSQITSMCMSPKSYQGLRYLCVCVNGLIRMYNVYEQINFMRSIDIISNTFKGCVIYQSCITNCNRYLLTLSYDNINFDNKVYIHLIEISSGNVVSSSYLSLPAPKNKYKGNQTKDAREYSMHINPFKTSLQFVVFNGKGLLYFYRVTSIFTLQMMQLQELVALCRDKISNISCGCFISVGESAFEDAVLAIGTQNGSLVFVDCRTANIMIACVAVLSSPILGISYSKSHEEQHQKLILFSNSTFVTVFNLMQGLNSILISMDQKVKSQGEIKKIMTLDGEVTSKSNIQSNSQQIIITKAGSLWLLDYQDMVTVKVSSVHTQQINKAEIILGNNKQALLLTCSDDGGTKLSNLMNLQQVFQVYKPRKMVKCFNIEGNFTLISFNDQIYIYNKIDAAAVNQYSSIVSLGSFKLDTHVVVIENIPSTDNYYILTQNEALIIYVGLRPLQNTKRSQLSIKSSSFLSSQPKSSLLKNMQIIVQIKKITYIQSPFNLVVNSIHAPYDQFALISRPGKVTTWMRKCLKRNYNPIDELSNVHQLSYYLIDANSKNTIDTSYVKFIGQNQYLWGLYAQGMIQIRNFRQHSIIREINMSLQRITTMNCIGDQQFIFYVGDENGYIYIINENGLLIQKIKALQCKVNGISFGGQRKILVYGSKYAVTLNNIVIK